MCELFAMSASAPARIRYDLDSFAAEGGERHLNRDGWGIVFAEGRDAHYFREAAPASDSELSRFIREHEQPHGAVIAHVRRASKGRRSLENTHPFRRTVRGRVLHFAHNGTLRNIEGRPGAAELLHERVGDTDSELAFLMLLDRLERRAPDPANSAGRFDVFSAFCHEMSALGPANFLWFDGDNLFAHADQRVFETPEGLSSPRAPGLHILRAGSDTLGDSHHCVGARLTDLPPQIVLFASLPLSDGPWEPLARGTALAVVSGEVVHRRVNKPW